MKEIKLIFTEVTDFRGGIESRTNFDNGYGVSVVKNPYSYGGKENKYELAVLKDGSICYDTEITNDVLGYLTLDEVEEIADQIASLPKSEPSVADD